MRCRRTFIALAMGLLFAPLTLLCAQPASAQRPYGGRPMYSARQFRPQHVQAARPPHPQNHPQYSSQPHPQGGGAHPNGNPGANANHPNGAVAPGANQGGRHPSDPNTYRPPTNANGAQGQGTNGPANQHAGVAGQDPAKLPGPWVQRLGQMSPQQQEHFMQNNERFRSLPPERQQQIRQNLQRYNSLSPAERDRVEHSYQTWQHMSPDQKQYVQRTLLPKWQQMSPDRKQVVTGRLHTLQQMSPSERQAALNDPRFMQGLSPDEQSVLRGLDSVRNPGP
jgi:Protein of unknown function (DUF3106)